MVGDFLKLAARYFLPFFVFAGILVWGSSWKEAQNKIVDPNVGIAISIYQPDMAKERIHQLTSGTWIVASAKQGNEGSWEVALVQCGQGIVQTEGFTISQQRNFENLKSVLQTGETVRFEQLTGKMEIRPIRISKPT